MTETKTVWRRQLLMLFCALLLFGSFLITPAYADEATISTVVGGTNYFQTFNSAGRWVDLGTPKHYVTATGEVAYCVQTELGEPQNAGYYSIDGSSLYDTYAVRKGIQIILENGYPSRTEGFTDDEARYATANAIRFFLVDCGELYVPAWMNLNAYSQFFRAKSGYERLFNWCMDLRNMANAQQGAVSAGTGSISFSNSNLTLSESGNYYTGTVTVRTSNCAGGYYLDYSGLPSGASVNGYTGNNGDNLTIYIPSGNPSQSYTLRAYGQGYSKLGDVKYYAPYNSSLQHVVTYVSADYGGYETIASASMTVNTPAPSEGTIRITKTDSVTGAALSGVWFYLYDSTGNFHSSNYTNASGQLEFTISPGQYSYREAQVVDGYILDDTKYPVTVTAGQTEEISVTNDPIQTSSMEITKLDAETGQPLHGVTIGLYDSNGTLIESTHTDPDGIALFTGLELGSYKYGEVEALPGYVLDTTLHDIEVTEGNLNYTATLYNDPLTGVVNITKVDAVGNTLSGAEFVLMQLNSNGEFELIETAVTDSSGKLSFSGLGLAVQTYRVLETKAPPGHSLQAAVVFEGVLDNENTEVNLTVCDGANITMPFTGSGGFTYMFAPMFIMGFFAARKRREIFNEN